MTGPGPRPGTSGRRTKADRTARPERRGGRSARPRRDGARAASPFDHPVFRAMWIALTVSYVGSFVQDIGERWLILDLTTTALPSAMLSTAFVLASLVAMLPAGFLADRRDRRVLVLLSQIAQAVPAAVIAVLSWTGRVTPGALLAASTVMGLGMALGSPAWNALVLDIVPRGLVPDAIALAAISFNVARAVGPAIGGVVLAELGAPASFGLNAGSFLVVVGAIVVWPPPRRIADAEESGLEPGPKARGSAAVMASAFAEPFRIFTRDRGVRAATLAMLLFTFGASMVYALAPAYGKTTLEASARGYGVMIGAMGTGAILGVYVLKRLRPLLRPRLLIGATACLYAVSALALSQAHGVVTATILFLPAGVGWTGTFASLSALVQIWTPERLRARIIAVYTMLHFALWALGSTLGGLLADHGGVRVAMLAGAAVCLGTGLLTARLPLPISFVGPDETEGLRRGEDAPSSRSDARASAA